MERADRQLKAENEILKAQLEFMRDQVDDLLEELEGDRESGNACGLGPDEPETVEEGQP